MLRRIANFDDTQHKVGVLERMKYYECLGSSPPQKKNKNKNKNKKR